jgi:hypothetical protein
MAHLAYLHLLQVSTIGELMGMLTNWRLQQAVLQEWCHVAKMRRWHAQVTEHLQLRRAATLASNVLYTWQLLALDGTQQRKMQLVMAEDFATAWTVKRTFKVRVT